MSDIDSVAERNRLFDGQVLADYIPVALPIYSFQADVLFADKRQLLPLEEYILRAVDLGIHRIDEVAALLGVDAQYATDLALALVDSDLLGLTEGADYYICRKGRRVLEEDGEDRLDERSMPVLWDPFSRRIVNQRISLVSPNEMRGSAFLKAVPRDVRAPKPADLVPSDLDLVRGNARLRSSASTALRCVDIRRPSLRYRLATLLLYAGPKASSPIARLAIGGRVDDALTSNFLMGGAAEALGVDKAFYKRLGTQAVDQRIKKLGLEPGAHNSYGDLLQRRSTLRLSIETLERMEDPDNEMLLRVTERRSALLDVELELEKFPVRSLAPFEISQLVRLGCARAANRLLITTTLPDPLKCDAIFLQLLKKAVEREVNVDIFLVGRPPQEFMSSKNKRWSSLQTFVEYANAHKNFRVHFLKDQNKVAFECLVDTSQLVVSNEPALGSRPGPVLARQFTGYVVNGESMIQTYEKEYLSDENLEVVERFRYQRDN